MAAGDAAEQLPCPEGLRNLVASVVLQHYPLTYVKMTIVGGDTMCTDAMKHECRQPAERETAARRGHSLARQFRKFQSQKRTDGIR